MRKLLNISLGIIFVVFLEFTLVQVKMRARIVIKKGLRLKNRY